MTPEERLFRVIGEKSGGGEPAQARALIGPKLFSRWWSVGKLQRWFTDRPIQRLNLVLIYLLAVLLIYLIYDVATAQRRFRKYSEIPASSNSILEQNSVVAPAPSVDEYLAVLNQRNAFQITAPVASAGSAAGTAAAVSPLEGLKLVGIAWSDQPEAIINDTRVNKTFFLKAGNRLGPLTIREITRESVVFVNDNGQVEELR